MYFLVSLKQTAQTAVIPQKWIQNLNMESILNSGVQLSKRKLHKVYISNVDSEEPDFQLTVLTRLNLRRPACYQAYIVKAFKINTEIDTVELGLLHDPTAIHAKNQT